MYKMLLAQVIAPGKGVEYRVYQEKVQRIFDQYGIPRKVWSVEGRKVGQALVEFGPFDSREELEAAQDKLYADEEWQDLHSKRDEAGVVVPGTQEFYILTDW